MRRSAHSKLFFAALVWLLSVSVAHAYLTDTSIHTPPVYSGIPVGAGGSFADPAFGTSIKRLSSAMSAPSAVGGNLIFVMTEYSTMSPFNMNNSRLILQHRSYYGMYDGAGNFIKNLPLEVHASSEPRWSRRQANLLYFISGNQLKRLDVVSGATSVVRAFTEYGSISGRGESDISFDGDHFVFVGDGRQIFVYEISSNTKGAVLDTGGRGLDSVYVTPDNNVTVTWLQSGSGRYNGIELFDRNMQFRRQMVTVGGHMDMARDTNGDEVMLWANAADPAPRCNNAVVKVRMSDGHQTCLISFDWNLALNISAADNNGWVYVATYAPGDPLPGSGAWPVYTNEILQMRLDGSEVRRLAHHRSRPFNGYNYTPRPSVSRDGSRLAFSSNFGMQLEGYPADYSDAYLINVPKAGATGGGDPGGGDGGPGGGGGGSTGGVTHVEEDGAGVSFSGTWFLNTSGGHSGGAAKLSMESGAAASYSFHGTGARWIAYRDQWSGIADILLDGTFVHSVDAYASPGGPQAVAYEIGGLSDGAHTLEVVVTGRRRDVSGGAWVWVDAFESVAPTVAPPSDGGGGGGGGGGDTGGGGAGGTSALIEQDNAAVSYTPGWYPNNSGAHSGGSALLAMGSGERATLHFTGTGASWITYRDEWSGIARVYVDGRFVGEVDTYATPGGAQKRVYSVRDLAAGAHELVIEVTQRKNPASGGAWVWIDAFEIIR